jgi:hypothetical protein
MSERENFLSRWSRLKQEAERKGEASDDAPAAAQTPAPLEPASQNSASRESSPPQSEDRTAEPEFDVSTLPPIESIGANSDISAFLQKGVPLDLTRAALRRAWTSDPAIRDFIEVAENQWDFATGSDLPGFGALQPGDDIRRMVAEVFQPSSDRAGVEAPDNAQQIVDAGAQSAENQRDPQGPDVAEVPAANPNVETASQQEPASDAVVQRKEEIAALQQEPKNTRSRLPNMRRHGRAVPQ